jgi:hypothetical protein
MDRFSTRPLSMAAAVSIWLAVGAVLAIAWTLFHGPRPGAFISLDFLLVSALIIREATTRISGSLAARRASDDWQKSAFDFRYRDDRAGWASLHDAATVLQRRGYRAVGEPVSDGHHLAQRFERARPDRVD